MNYIQRAQIAQRILTAAGDVDVTAVTLYGYRDTVTIQTHGPIDGYEYAPRHENGYPIHRFAVDDVEVELTYVPDKEVAA